MYLYQSYLVTMMYINIHDTLTYVLLESHQTMQCSQHEISRFIPSWSHWVHFLENILHFYIFYIFWDYFIELQGSPEHQYSQVFLKMGNFHTSLSSTMWYTFWRNSLDSSTIKAQPSWNGRELIPETIEADRTR